MRKILFCATCALFLLLISVTPSIAGPCTEDQEAPTIYVPDRSCFDLAYGYQYVHLNNFRQINDNGVTVDFGMHLVDWLTGAEGRLTVGAEVLGAFGFGNTVGTPRLTADSIFAGAGPHVAIQSRSRLEPWAHVLAGAEHLRFTQQATFGSNTAFGYMVGGGLDVRIERGLYWRVQADYLGTVFTDVEQSNVSAGTGLILYF